MDDTEAVKMLREALETWNWNMGVEGSRLFDERRRAALAATAEPATVEPPAHTLEPHARLVNPFVPAPTYSADDLRKVAREGYERGASDGRWGNTDAERQRMALDAIIAKAVK